MSIERPAEHHALEIYRRMIDKVRRKAADDEKKKEEDLKKKEEVSKKLEEAKPGNLLVSVVRKVIKEEQGDSNMGVETKNDGDVVKDIEQAADAFASRVVAGRSVEKDTIHKGKGNESSSKEKTLPKKGKGKGNSKGKNGKLGKIEKKDGKGSKNVVSPGKAGGKGTNKDGKKNTRKGGTKGKNKGDKNGGKGKEGPKLTFTDVERLFMNLMKGANEEDWNFLVNFERDDYTRIYDHGTKSVYKAVSLPWTWRFILTRFNRKHILCDRSLPRADRARRCLDELGWKIEWKHHFQKHASEMLPFRVPYQRTAVFSALPCPPLRSWLHRLKSTVLSVLQEDRSKGMGSTAHVKHVSDDSLGSATYARWWLDIVAKRQGTWFQLHSPQ